MSMLHPSYKEMIEKMNADTKDRDDTLEITSRYSLVIAAAKRARQINAGAEPLVDVGSKDRNLSVAVKEIYNDKVHILNEEAAARALMPDDEELYDEEYDGDAEEEADGSEEEA